MRASILFCLVAGAVSGCGGSKSEKSAPVASPAPAKDVKARGVGQGNGLTTYNNDVMRIRFSYPTDWKLSESPDSRQVNLDNSPLVPLGKPVSQIQFSLVPDLFGQRVSSAEDLLAQLQKRWADRTWSYVVFHSGQTGYFWKDGGTSPYLGEYYLLDPNHQILEISYKSYLDLQGSEMIDAIVASLAVVDEVDCDVIVTDPAGRPVWEGTDQLRSERAFDLDGTDDRAPNGLAHYTSTKGLVMASHTLQLGGKSASFSYSLGYRVAMINFVDVAHILDAQVSCLALGLSVNGQEMSDGCVAAGDDPEYWPEEPNTGIWGAPWLDLDLVPAKTLALQGAGTVQVSCRPGGFIPGPGGTLFPLAYAHRDPGARGGRLVHLGLSPGSPSPAAACGATGELCQCVFATTSDQVYLPSYPYVHSEMNSQSGELTCTIPDSVSPESIKFVLMNGPNGLYSDMIMLATIPRGPR